MSSANQQADADMSDLQHIFGSLSAASCFTVILTYYIFKDIRNLRYVELVFYVSLNDMIASIGVALGRSENGSFVCWFQGLTSNIQYLTAVFWTVVIAYQLWLAVHYNKTIQDMRLFHLFCWGFPVVLSLLPLSTNTYGNTDDASAWCFVSNRSDSPKWGILFWEITSFYCWIWISIVCSVALIVSARRKLKSIPTDTESAKKAVSATKLKIMRLVWYPVIISSCWIVSTIIDIYDVYHHDLNRSKLSRLDRAATVFSIMQGILFAGVFFAMNPMIRYKWSVLLHSICKPFRCCCVCCASNKPKQTKNNDNNNGNNNDANSDQAMHMSSVDDQSRGTMVLQTIVSYLGASTSINRTTSQSFDGYNIEDEPDYIPPRDRTSSSTAGLGLVRRMSNALELPVFGSTENRVNRSPSIQSTCTTVATGALTAVPIGSIGGAVVINSTRSPINNSNNMIMNTIQYVPNSYTPNTIMGTIGSSDDTGGSVIV